MKNLVASLMLGVLCLAAPAMAAESLHVMDPWIRAAPPVAQTQAAYMTLHNVGTQEKVLVGASTPAFAKVEVHETVQHEGKSLMRPKPTLPIAPGAQVQLAPGGLHIMLIGPQKPLQPKEQVTITLKFSDGSALPVIAEVREATTASPKGAGGEHQHH